MRCSLSYTREKKSPPKVTLARKRSFQKEHTQNTSQPHLSTCQSSWFQQERFWLQVSYIFFWKAIAGQKKLQAGTQRRVPSSIFICMKRAMFTGSYFNSIHIFFLFSSQWQKSYNVDQTANEIQFKCKEHCLPLLLELFLHMNLLRVILSQKSPNHHREKNNLFTWPLWDKHEPPSGHMRSTQMVQEYSTVS